MSGLSMFVCVFEDCLFFNPPTEKIHVNIISWRSGNASGLECAW